MSSAWVTQNGTETELTIWPGENLLEALRRGGFFVNAVCGGKGTCGKCRVILEGKDAARESVLACQTVFSDSIRRILLPEDDSDSMDVETGRREGGSPVIPLPRRKKEGGAEDRYGVCVDLGTTTVVTELYSLTEGRQAGQRSGRNRQSVYGADVISPGSGDPGRPGHGDESGGKYDHAAYLRRSFSGEHCIGAVPSGDIVSGRNSAGWGKLGSAGGEPGLLARAHGPARSLCIRICGRGHCGRPSGCGCTEASGPVSVSGCGNQWRNGAGGTDRTGMLFGRFRSGF